MIRNCWYSIFLVFTCCDFIVSQEKIDSTYNKGLLPYDLLNPDKTVKLPDELNEISGLAWYDGNLATVDDEDGSLFIISTSGEILEKVNFDKGDDYEGVAVAGNFIYVVEASGDIFRINPSGEGAEKFETSLNHGNDAEGLAYDKMNNRLIVACKKNAGIKEDIDGRAVYSFDLGNKELSDKPLFIMQQKDLNQRMKNRESDFKIQEFGPSGVAIHPATAQIYIISHRGKSLVVLDESFKIQEVVRLRNRTFKQPEGICFSPDGTLFISNEGRGGLSNLLKFSQISAVD
jgi:uncharacterized protein YjiK